MWLWIWKREELKYGWARFRNDAKDLIVVPPMLSFLKQGYSLANLEEELGSTISCYYYQSRWGPWRFCLFKEGQTIELTKNGRELLTTYSDEKDWKRCFTSIIMRTIPFFWDLLRFLATGAEIKKENDYCFFSLQKEEVSLSSLEMYEKLDFQHRQRFGSSYGYIRDKDRIKTVDTLVCWLIGLELLKLRAGTLWEFNMQLFNQYIESDKFIYNMFVRELK